MLRLPVGGQWRRDRTLGIHILYFTSNHYGRTSRQAAHAGVSCLRLDVLRTSHWCWRGQCRCWSACNNDEGVWREAETSFGMHHARSHARLQEGMAGVSLSFQGARGHNLNIFRWLVSRRKWLSRLQRLHCRGCRNGEGVCIASFDQVSSHFKARQTPLEFQGHCWIDEIQIT